MRESIFNLLGQDVAGLRVLDLFAGTGSLGLEALSRGASEALFIDRSRQAINLIIKNLELCGYRSKGHALRKDLHKGLPSKHAFLEECVDLVFLDPPYGKDLIPPRLEELSKKGFLNRGGVVIAETSKTDNLPGAFAALQLLDSRFYGETKIVIYHVV